MGMILPSSQFGFRADRNTLSARFSLTQMIQKRMDDHTKMHVLIIDLKRAFTSIDRSLLTKIMIRREIPRQYENSISNIRSKTNVFIKTNNGFMKYGYKYSEHAG